MRHARTPVLVFDPRGIVDQAITPCAPRKAKLDGLRLGILDNSKWNANKLLRGASAALSANTTFTAVNYYVKQSFSKDAAPELIEQIAQENDIVLTAIGEFVKETELTLQALGMTNFTPIVIDHPISSITQDEIERRVRQIKKQAEEIWMAQ